MSTNLDWILLNLCREFSPSTITIAIEHLNLALLNSSLSWKDISSCCRDSMFSKSVSLRSHSRRSMTITASVPTCRTPGKRKSAIRALESVRKMSA